MARSLFVSLPLPKNQSHRGMVFHFDIAAGSRAKLPDLQLDKVRLVPPDFPEHLPALERDGFILAEERPRLYQLYKSLGMKPPKRAMLVKDGEDLYQALGVNR